MSRTVHRTVVAVLLIAWLRAPVVAGPTPSDSTHHDRDGATTASVTDSPWIDLAPSKVLAEIAAKPEPAPDHKVAASLTLAGAYAAFTTWTYFAWYRNKHKTDRETCRGTIHWSYCWGGDGLFGATTYAGGADKLGHAWAGLIWARGGTELLHQWGGFDKRTSSIVGAVLSEALYFGVEIKDGAYYEFSYGDLAFDTLGVLAGLAMSNSPRLDELFDFRVQYWPSRAYRRQLANDGNVNVAEDYTGETYLLAFHLGGIHALRDHKYGTWSRFVDLAIGFETRGYKPDPLPTEPDFDHHQKLFLGVTLNAQGIFDYLFEGRSKPAKKITHGVFEIFNIPYTTLPVLDTTRSSLITDPGGA